MTSTADDGNTYEAALSTVFDENTLNDEAESNEHVSALQDNIERKGKNAYYFAHARKANGPEWDGKVEPRLLGKEVSNINHSGSHPQSCLRSLSSFDHTSNITNYAFTNDGEDKVKIYVDLPDVEADYPSEEDVLLEFTEQSFALSLWKSSGNEEPSGKQLSQRICDKRLAFSKLFAPIESASLKRRKDKIVLTLVKSENTEWSSIGAK